MGLFGRNDARTVQPELPEERSGPLDEAANFFVGRIMNLGLDGVGPMDSASQVAAKAREKHGGDVEKAVSQVVSDHVKLAGAEGFVTGLGGVVTMPVALPLNVVGFYALATRMVAAVAQLRGYDVTTPGARSAIMLALVGADADDLVRKAGLNVATGWSASGRLAQMAVSKMPRAAATMVNKAVGFRLLTNLGGKALARFIRFVPVAGGIVGAGLDGLLMKRLADHARREFILQPASVPGEVATTD